MPKYRSVVFLQDPADFDRWYVEFDEGYDEGFEYLLQWEYGEDGEVTDTEPWGNSDTIYECKDGDLTYVVAYNWNLAYVSLTQVIEVSE